MGNMVLSDQKLFYSSEELKDLGYSYYMVRKMIMQGKLSKLNNKYYENQEYEGVPTDYSYISVYAPHGVVCLLSAARFYNLTTYLPDSVDLALERDMKVSTLPEWPHFHPVYFSKERYETGVVTDTDGTAEFRIYDREKTVADILYYRSRVGMDETKEILKNYLSSPERNLPLLHEYADHLGCRKILSTYLEVLL